MQIVDDRTAAQIEEILAHAPIARPSSLPPAHMGQGMLNRHPFTKLGSSLRGLLTLAQLDEQGFIRMDTDAASLRTGRALGFQRALRAGAFGKMNDAARHKGHFLLGRAADDLLFPSPAAKACL